MKRFAILLLLAGCGLDNALVGGHCRAGYEEVGGSCVASASALDAGAGPDASGNRSDDAGEEADAGVSVIPGTTDDAGRPTLGVETGPIPGLLLCDIGYTACGATCESLADDGHNCGACGKICPSNICVNGECVGAMAGDVVLVGHDFTNAWNGSAQAKVLSNAISIPTTDPIRVLSFEDGADEGAVAQARSLMSLGVGGRKVKITRATKQNLESMTLALSYDVVVLHDTGDASLGARWKDALPRFAQKGGVIVALDGGASHVSDLLGAAGLLQVGAHVMLPAQTHLLVENPGDVIGTQVLSPYAAFGPPVAFQSVESGPDVTFVVRVDDADALPVVVHKTFQ